MIIRLHQIKIVIVRNFLKLYKAQNNILLEFNTIYQIKLMKIKIEHLQNIKIKKIKSLLLQIIIILTIINHKKLIGQDLHHKEILKIKIHQLKKIISNNKNNIDINIKIQ